MTMAIHRDTASHRARRSAGSAGYKTRVISPYFGPAPGVAGALTNDDGPQAFLARIEPPGGVIRPHFHTTPQFQVFVSGEGKFGKHDFSPITVHYADAFTTYGPIRSSDEGMVFFTLRRSIDGGAQFMPESRDKAAGLPGKPGRSLTAVVAAQSLAAPLPERDCVDFERLVEDEEDGLRIDVVRVPPQTFMRDTGVSPGGGGFWLVLHGSIVLDGDAFPERSLFFVPRDGERLAGTAEESGVVLLRMEFGRDGSSPRS